MAVFQELMKAGSVHHRAYSGIAVVHRPGGGLEQRLSGILAGLERIENQEGETVLLAFTGVLMVVADELNDPVTRLSKFSVLLSGDRSETIFNVDDQQRINMVGIYWEIPIYYSTAIRKSDGDSGYKRDSIGR